MLYHGIALRPCPMLKSESVAEYWGQSIRDLPARVALWVWGLVRFR